MKNRTLAVALLLLRCASPAAAQTAAPTQTAAPAPTPARPPAPTPTPAPSPAETKAASDAQKKYDEMLEKAKKGEGAVDYRALRFAYFETPAYNPLAGMLIQRTLWGLLSQGNAAEAAKQAESALEKNYVDVNAHMVAFVAHRELKNEEKAKLHRTWADGLLESIKAGGDGKSAETAWHVISTSEEYALMRAMNLRPTGQSLVKQNGHVYDLIKTVDPRTNAETSFYFNVDKPFSAYGRK